MQMTSMLLLWYLLFSLTHAATVGSIYYEYCKIKCGRGTHTVCKRASHYCRPDSKCNNMKEPIMTDKIRQVIVDRHNELRSQVARGLEKTGSQPEAANMNALNYNFELEFIAQCLANTCVFEHDKCRDTKQLKCGQNLAELWKSSDVGLRNEETVLALIKGWYDEVKLLNVAEIDSFMSGAGAGHYTQMVWGNIEYIGCGRGFYKKRGNYHILLVCNYGGKTEGGNMMTHPIYIKGKPCSKCPPDRKCNSATGLCGEVHSVKNVPRFSHASNVRIDLGVYCFIIVLFVINNIVM